MAVIDREWKRKIRISSLPNNPTGRALDVVDAETGEPIFNIVRMVISLERSKVNECEITYHEVDGDALRIDDDGHIRTFDMPKESTITVKDVEIDDLTAFEIMDNIRKDMR